MSEPAVLNLTIERGINDPRGLDIIVETDAGDEPLPLTDCVLRLQAWSAFGGSKVLDMTSSNGGIVITSLAGGLADLVFSAELTADATWVSASYVLDLTLPDATEIRLCRGTLTLAPEEPV